MKVLFSRISGHTGYPVKIFAGDVVLVPRSGGGGKRADSRGRGGTGANWSASINGFILVALVLAAPVNLIRQFRIISSLTSRGI